jgi:anti-anti-sigma factor
MVERAEWPSHAGVRFQVDVHPAGDRVRVVPIGELDLATAAELEDELQELREFGFVHIVLDLRRLEFLSSAGLRLLVVEDELARRGDHGFVVVAGSPAIQRVIEMSGLLEHLCFVSPT